MYEIIHPQLPRFEISRLETTYPDCDFRGFPQSLQAILV
jgi:hypothetical protein